MYDNFIDVTPFIEEADPELSNAMKGELSRQRDHIELIASENFASPYVLAAMSSVLTNKYAEGYPSHRYYGGCTYVDEVENIAISRACKLFGAEHANVQPHSGAQANLGAYFALANSGDTIMGMDLSQGGHLTHGSKVNFSGTMYNFVPYGVREDDGRIDYNEVRDIAKACSPKIIVAGASAYPRAIDFKAFRDIADEVGAFLMVDMAHISGLVAAGLHMSPIPYADVVTTTTHKTLRGPRGGLILCREELAKKIDKAIFPGTQGGPLEHVIAAKAVCFGEALKPEFIEYQKKVIENAKRLAEGFIKEGVKLVSGGTDNHLMMLDLRDTNVTGKELEKRLDDVSITTNKNMIPADPQSPFITSGLRLGTPAVTTRGFGVEEMDIISKLITTAIFDFEAKRENILEEVTNLCKAFPIYR